MLEANYFHKNEPQNCAYADVLIKNIFETRTIQKK